VVAAAWRQEERVAEVRARRAALADLREEVNAAIVLTSDEARVLKEAISDLAGDSKETEATWSYLAEQLPASASWRER
jgi:hypothetical protein